MVFPVKFIIYSIVLTALLTINAVQAVEGNLVTPNFTTYEEFCPTRKRKLKPSFLVKIEVDQRFAPTRRLADPRLMRWDNEIDSIFDDDYEGEFSL